MTDLSPASAVASRYRFRARDSDKRDRSKTFEQSLPRHQMAMSGHCHAQSGFAVMEDAPNTFMVADEYCTDSRSSISDANIAFTMH